MIAKMFKAMWFLSVLAALGGLLWVYASLPQQVIIQDDANGRMEASREFLFYVFTAILMIVNVLVFFVRKLSKDDTFVAWFYGVIITINIFFIVAFNVLGVYNSSESFDFSTAGIVVYLSLGLMVAWTLSWPVIAFFRKSSSKQVLA